MAVNPYALDALRKLAGTSYSPQFDSSQQDPTIQRYNLAQDFADETKDRIIANQRAQAAALSMSDPGLAQRTAASYGGEVTALKNLLGTQEQDIEESGVPQGVQAAQDYRDAERNAILAGFPGGMYQGRQYASPQAAQAATARQMEQDKINAPIRSAEAAAQAEIEKQRLASEGAKDVAKIQAESIAQQYANLQAALAGGNADAIKSFTLPKGGGSVSYQSPTGQSGINVQLAKQVTAARQAYEDAKAKQGFLGHFFGVPDSNIDKAQATYQQAVGQLFANSGYDQDVQDLATHIFTDPNLNSMNVEQALPHIVDENDQPVNVSPEQMHQIQQLLQYARGVDTAGTSPEWFGTGQGGM